MENTSQYNLTKEQQEAVNQIKNFLQHPTRQIFTLTGIGGAGKTFCLKEAIKDSFNVYAAAVSHSAKNVMEEDFNAAKIDVKCFTLAKLLGLKMIITDDGAISFIPDNSYNNKPKPIEFADLLVIDECSMISTEYHNMILALKKRNCKIIYLGDAFQLPPVDENLEDSITFNFVSANLTQPIRYTGPIFDLGKRVRAEIDKINTYSTGSKYVLNDWTSEQGFSRRTSHVNNQESGYIFLNDIKDVIRIASMFFNSDLKNDGIKLIGYRNATIEKLNLGMRQVLYGQDVDAFVSGELIIANGPYGEYGEIYNNQTFEVLEATKSTGHAGLPVYNLDLIPRPPLPLVQVLDKELGFDAYLRELAKLKNNAKADPKQWKHYYHFKEQFADFDYNYSQNAYRAQGRTYQNVIVFEGDILSLKKVHLKAKLQALYVACTRAKEIVFIYNKDYKVDNSKLPEYIKQKFSLK